MNIDILLIWLGIAVTFILGVIVGRANSLERINQQKFEINYLNLKLECMQKINKKNNQNNISDSKGVK